MSGIAANMPTQAEYEARMQKGIELLDVQFPEWWEKINLDTLDIASGTMCMTAQSYGIKTGEDPYWTKGADMFGLDPYGEGEGSNYENVSDYIGHGFNSESQESVTDYDADVPDEGGLPGFPGWEDYDYVTAVDGLTQMWRHEILLRRHEASKSL